MESKPQVIECPHCAKRYAVKPLSAPKRVRCPDCRESFDAGPPPPASAPKPAEPIVWDNGGDEAEGGGLPWVPMGAGAGLMVLLVGGILWYFAPWQSRSDDDSSAVAAATTPSGSGAADRGVGVAVEPIPDGTAPASQDPSDDPPEDPPPLVLTDTDLASTDRLLAIVNVMYPGQRVPGDYRDGMVDAAIANLRAGDAARYRELLDHYLGFSFITGRHRLVVARTLIRAGMIPEAYTVASGIESGPRRISFYIALLEKIGYRPSDSSYQRYVEEAWSYAAVNGADWCRTLALVQMSLGDVDDALAMLEQHGDDAVLYSDSVVLAIATHGEDLGRALAFLPRVGPRWERNAARIGLIGPLVDAGRRAEAIDLIATIEDEVVQRRGRIVLHIAELRHGLPVSEAWDTLAEAAWADFVSVSSTDWHELALAVVEGHLAMERPERAWSFFERYIEARDAVYHSRTARHGGDLFERYGYSQLAYSARERSGDPPALYGQSGLKFFLEDGRLNAENLETAIGYAMGLTQYRYELLQRFAFEVYAQWLEDSPAWVVFATTERAEADTLYLCLGMLDGLQTRTSASE